MAVKKKKIKRKINSGLKAWNDARSYISAENRKVNKKYDYLFVNELTKQFLGEHYGKSFDKTDLDYFLTTTFEKFYDVSVKASVGDLADIPYYLIDSSITGTRKGIDVIVNAGEELYGVVKLNTSNYSYQNSGLRDIIERIRKDYGLKTSDKHPRFSGSLIKNADAPKDAKDDDPRYISLEWVLSISGELVSEIKGMIQPSIDSGRDLIFKKHERKKSNSKKTTSTTGLIESKGSLNYTAKEIIEMEKQKQATAKKVIASEKQKLLIIKQETSKLDMVLKLIKAGYTKSEISKLLKNK